MDGMMKAVAKNMEATMSQPVFRVSREIGTDSFDELYAVSVIRAHLPFVFTIAV
jgi:hypothetical protein